MIKRYVKMSDFLKLEIKPFVLGAFLSRIMTEQIGNQNYYFAYSSFKSSKYVYKNDFDIINYTQTYIDKLNKLSGHCNWIVKRVSNTFMEVRFYLLDDIGLTKLTLYNTLYKKLLSSSFIFDEALNENKKDFIRGFLELRGSVDTTAKFIAQDYFYSSQIEIKKAQIFTDIMNIPLKYANFNMRNLQPQFVSGESQRNAQFRIHSFYYAKYIGFLNDYKAQVFSNAFKINESYKIENIVYFNLNLPNSKSDDIAFIKMINFFTNNIYHKELSTLAIKELRKKLGLSESGQNEPKRNMSLIKLFNEISPDECAICGTKTTYTNPTTGRQQFEIHHMISFKNGEEFDNIANLVKLCPNCHAKLGKGSATKDQQIKAILKILHKHQEVFEFASSYLVIDDINDLSEQIWQMLG